MDEMRLFLLCAVLTVNGIIGENTFLLGTPLVPFEVLSYMSYTIMNV